MQIMIDGRTFDTQDARDRFTLYRLCHYWEEMPDVTVQQITQRTMCCNQFAEWKCERHGDELRWFLWCKRCWRVWWPQNKTGFRKCRRPILHRG